MHHSVVQESLTCAKVEPDAEMQRKSPGIKRRYGVGQKQYER